MSVPRRPVRERIPAGPTGDAAWITRSIPREVPAAAEVLADRFAPHLAARVALVLGAVRHGGDHGVDDHHAVAREEKRVDHVRPDEAEAARDDDVVPARTVHGQSMASPIGKHHARFVRFWSPWLPLADAAGTPPPPPVPPPPPPPERGAALRPVMRTVAASLAAWPPDVARRTSR